MPLEVAFYTRPEFADEVNAVLATEKVDAVISFFMRTAEYVRKRTGLRKILVAEDCRVLYQSRSARATNNALQRMVRWWETRKLRAYEPRVADDFDVTTLVSAHDLENMRLNNPRARYSVVTNGVDAERFWFRADQHDRQGLLFAGKLDVQANHLMALTVLQEVYPEIKRYMPEAPLQIVGARPLPELLKVVEGVATLHRDVPDVLPFLHTSSVFVHPHKGGSGIQNKVLEAMAAGCVVVTTPSGLQGINAQHGVHCLVGATSREVADHAVRLLNDAPLRTELAYRARMLMESEHTWERVGEQIDAVLNGVAHPQPQTV
jgi:glycosyltransferase involved in cell wall biosynthesis